ncbi:MAG: leucine-rich repeat domain-containing protein [Verrucomicrobiae bacterium]|nr:leucine-rich repeat domain-containing protein [Verrucomicrobiae bacterium]
MQKTKLGFETGCVKNSKHSRLLITVLWIAVIGLLPRMASAQFTWATNAGDIIIESYTTNSPGALTIPATITGLPVTEIQLVNSPNVTSITLGTNVITIDGEAFSGCTSLTNVIFDANLQSIGSFAFYGCPLISVSLGTNVNNIGLSAFQDCIQLTNLTVNPANPYYASLVGVLFDKNLTTLVEYPHGRTGNYIMTNRITTIQGYAFAYTAGLTGIVLDTNLVNIGNDAFYLCSSLTNFAIPTNVTTIGYDTFAACSSLTSITIPNNVTSLGVDAFTSCTKLTNAVIGSGVANIGPGTVPFDGCTSLTAITVNAGNPALSSPGGVLYNHNQTVILEYPPGKAAGSYVISNTVTDIGDFSFADCANLTGITIPNGVTNIGAFAFASCNLGTVSVPNNVRVLGDGVFEFNHNLTNAVIGSGLTSMGSSEFYYCENNTQSLNNVLFMGNAPGAGSSNFDGDNFTTYIYYLPNTTGWTSAFAGVPTALWTLPYPVILTHQGLGVQTNRFNFTIAWATNLSVVVQACTNLSNQQWLPVQTNSLTNGLWNFSDAKWTNSKARFYRVYHL